ncbi:hypothetical protein BSZ36_03650 [Rubricoccus marinus]|uniref:Uncharacterized protein n=2 Tax=Rubricoccus marinus TaxID=716817 RepID=A0A259TX81_9BACT|nr:hypothetical protein BSZ36_03650 [Rubricoccus marinus]
MLRMGYTPAAKDRRASSDTRRARFSVASGVASGYKAGATQSEMRLSLPVGKALYFEPAVAYTAVRGYDAFPNCAPGQTCAPVRKNGDDAVSLGVGVSAHSGRVRVSTVSLADMYVGTSVYVNNPWNSESADSRLTLLAGAAVPLARGLALGAEVQAASYAWTSSSETAFPTYDGWVVERGRFSLAPMLRLTVGG